MTTDDAFERAVARETVYRRAGAHGGLTGTLTVLAMLAVPLPLHLWLAEWDTRAPSMEKHLIVLTVWATIVAIVAINERAERRADV